MKIENPTFEQIQEYLAKIGWSLRHCGCDHWYFYDHKEKCTGVLLLFPKTDSRIEIETDNKRATRVTVVMYMKELAMEILDETTVSFQGIRDKGLFILMTNYEMSRKLADERRKENPIKRQRKSCT